MINVFAHNVMYVINFKVRTPFLNNYLIYCARTLQLYRTS